MKAIMYKLVDIRRHMLILESAIAKEDKAVINSTIDIMNKTVLWDKQPKYLFNEYDCLVKYANKIDGIKTKKIKRHEQKR